MQSDLLSALLYEESGCNHKPCEDSLKGGARKKKKKNSTASGYNATLAAADQAHVNMQIRIMI